MAVDLSPIDESLLATIANIHGMPKGAFNIRRDGQLVERHNSAYVEISTKTDNPGIDIKVKPGTKGESVFIPVIVTQSGLKDVVYNTFYIGDDCDIRENVVIARATHKGDATTIGNHCFLMDGVHLCHDVKLDDWVLIGIKATLAGGAHVDSYTILSTNAQLQQNVHVGSWSFIQSGCRVSKDVPPYIIMAGNPAKYHGVNAQILRQNDKQPLDDRTIRHIMNAYYLIYQTSYSLEDATEKIIEQVPTGPQIEQILEFVKHSKGLTK